MTYELATVDAPDAPERPHIKTKARRVVKQLPWDDVQRSRIDSNSIIKRLVKHIDGELDLSATQIRAAEILLRKTLPDLATVDHKNAVGRLNITFNWGVERKDEAQIINGKAKQIEVKNGKEN